MEAKLADSPLRKQAVLTQAVVRTAGQLGLNQAQFAKVIGVSTATASRMFEGTHRLSPTGKPWELAVLLIRVFRSLDAIVAGRVEDLRAWFHSHNQALNGTPAQLVTEVAGLVNVMAYLDASRARI